MARPAIYHAAKRVNIIIEESLHAQALEKAADHKLRGGFSEYVARLIAADRKRKGRDLFKSKVALRKAA